MKCVICARPLRPGTTVVPVLKIIGNEKRGNFVGSTGEYAHLYHLNNESGR